jgi:SAM-dependent methyltransferase
MDPRRIVEQGYDDLDEAYGHWVRRAPEDYRAGFLEKVLDRVPPGADVLEIGCGPGTDARALAEGRRYVGVDLSAVQLRHAKRAAPTGTFLHGDVLNVAFPTSSLDAVVGFYVFNHIPPDRLRSLFRRILEWLRPDGSLFASFGTSDDPGSVQPMWLGRADMYFASLPIGESDALLKEVGFAIEFADTITEQEEDEGPATFHWVMAQKPKRERPNP